MIYSKKYNYGFSKQLQMSYTIYRYGNTRLNKYILNILIIIRRKKKKKKKWLLVKIIEFHRYKIILTELTNEAIIIAPGQEKQPLPWHKIQNIDELCFPRIFGGHPYDKLNILTYSERVLSEVRRTDRRSCTPTSDNIYLTEKKNIQLKTKTIPTNRNQLLSKIKTNKINSITQRNTNNNKFKKYNTGQKLYHQPEVSRRPQKMKLLLFRKVTMTSGRYIQKNSRPDKSCIIQPEVSRRPQKMKLLLFRKVTMTMTRRYIQKILDRTKVVSPAGSVTKTAKDEITFISKSHDD
ncbi:unnamed protein product, partial [Trichogramma brassicae]